MKSYRPERVASVVRAVVSDAILKRLSDPRIAPMSSVTRVEVSADLEHAKVFVSVMGSAGIQRRTLAGLQSARSYVQRLVARELSIRHCPHLTFHLDHSIHRAAEIIRLIDETIAADRAAAGKEEVDEADEEGIGPEADTGDEA